MPWYLTYNSFDGLENSLSTAICDEREELAADNVFSAAVEAGKIWGGKRPYKGWWDDTVYPCNPEIIFVCGFKLPTKGLVKGDTE